MKFKAEFKFDNSLVGIKHYTASSKLYALCKFYRDIRTQKLPSTCELLTIDQV